MLGSFSSSIANVNLPSSGLQSLSIHNQHGSQRRSSDGPLVTSSSVLNKGLSGIITITPGGAGPNDFTFDPTAPGFYHGQKGS